MTPARRPAHDSAQPTALLTPRAFAAKKPDSATQTWVLAVSAEEAIWMRQGDEAFSFRTGGWEEAK